MSDVGGWQLDPASMAGLRVRKAQQAFERGEWAACIVEAEELLDDQPDNVEALMLVGDAALELADSGLAQLALERLVELDPEKPHAWSGLAISSFNVADLELALHAADQAIALEPSLAEAWYYKGLALDHLGGRQAEAERCFKRANRLDPHSFPPHHPFTEAQFAAAQKKAMELLSPEMRLWYAEVPLEVLERPELEEIAGMDPPMPPSTGALFVGNPPEEGVDPWKLHPPAVRLYRVNLERAASLDLDLDVAIAQALRLEALDWLNLPSHEQPLRSRA